jgi:hypothetical protein
MSLMMLTAGQEPQGFQHSYLWQYSFACPKEACQGKTNVRDPSFTRIIVRRNRSNAFGRQAQKLEIQQVYFPASLRFMQ